MNASQPNSFASTGVSQSESILIVDDDANMRMALCRLLQLNGYRVYEASNGQDALSLAAQHYPGIAIVDLGLPGISGYEVLSSLRANFGASIHTAVVSGQTGPESRMAAFDAGADDFIAKPVDLAELAKKLRAAQRTQAATRNALIARERAERLQLFNSEASSLLAHDINNGIAISIANIQYVRDTCPCDEDQLDALVSSEKALRRIAMLTTNFVDVSRFEDGVLTPNRSDVDLHSLMAATVNVHEPRSKDGGKLIEIDCHVGLIANVDGVLLERVLHNLLGNAVRYTGSGGAIRLHVEPTNDGSNELVLKLSNSGMEIPNQLLPVLFEKYRKGADGKSMRGMGLYFCRMACEAHGGSIAVTSANGWTTFEIRIPGALRGLSN